MEDREWTDTAGALAALEKFVVENDDLLALESLIGRFNIFDALAIARAEIRHSNFLAFILDPAESHGQSQLFLKALLMDVLKAAPANLRPLSPIEIDGIDLRGVTIRREWQNIDLLITCEIPSFVIAIENKIGAKEHSNQLGRYRQTIARHYPDARPLYVFLTPGGESAPDGEWVSYSYGDVHRVLSRVRNTYANAIGDDVLVFLDHYLTLIGTRLMDDPRIDELCQRIYRNHRQALTLIYDRVSPTNGVLSEVEAAVRDDDRWHVFYRSGDVVDFVPKPWIEWLPALGMDRKEHPQSWFVFRFQAREHRLDFHVEIRKMSDASLRSAIIDMLLAQGLNYGFNRKSTLRETTGSYTRVSSRERVLTWDGDDDPESAVIRSAVKKKLDDLHPKSR